MKNIDPLVRAYAQNVILAGQCEALLRLIEPVLKERGIQDPRAEFQRLALDACDSLAFYIGDTAPELSEQILGAVEEQKSEIKKGNGPTSRY